MGLVQKASIVSASQPLLQQKEGAGSWGFPMRSRGSPSLRAERAGSQWGLTSSLQGLSQPLPGQTSVSPAIKREKPS